LIFGHHREKNRSCEKAIVSEVGDSLSCCFGLAAMNEPNGGTACLLFCFDQAVEKYSVCF